MTEVVSYDSLIDLHKVARMMSISLGYNVHYLGVEAKVPCTSSIHKAFKLVDWLSNPYQPIDVEIGPEDGYPEDYLESVHRLLSSSDRMHLAMHKGKTLFMKWYAPASVGEDRIYAHYMDEVLRIRKFIEGIRHGSIYC